MFLKRVKIEIIVETGESSFSPLSFYAWLANKSKGTNELLSVNQWGSARIRDTHATWDKQTVQVCCPSPRKEDPGRGKVRPVRKSCRHLAHSHMSPKAHGCEIVDCQAPTRELRCVVVKRAEVSSYTKECEGSFPVSYRILHDAEQGRVAECLLLTNTGGYTISWQS